MVKIEVFDTFLRKSIIMVDFDPYFLVQFPYRNRGILKEKYCGIVKQGDFDPLILVQFLYRNRGQNRGFSYYWANPTSTILL